MGKIKRIEDVYHDPKHPASFTGDRKVLAKHLGKTFLKKNNLEKWLQKDDSYSSHKPIRYKFKRRQTMAAGPRRQYQIDLLDTSKYSSSNEGVKFLLTAIDVFSKFAWAIPIPNKTGPVVANALKKILPLKKTPSLSIQSDKGTEFRNKHVQDLLKNKNIRFFTSENDDIKASIVERFNRTLQSKIHRYMTHKRTFTFLPVLKDLVEAYNNRVHSSTGLTPIFLANSKDRSIHYAVWNILYPDDKPWRLARPQFKVGDYVRINKTKGAFRKSYIAGWSREVFRVKKVDSTAYPVTYRIVDEAGEEVLGRFYTQELQGASAPEFYDVEKIVKKRKKNKKTQYLVKWLGYSDAHNSWVDEENLSEYR